MHAMLQSLMAQIAPTIPMAGIGYYGAGWNPNFIPSVPSQTRLNEYMSTADNGMQGTGMYLQGDTGMGSYNWANYDD